MEERDGGQVQARDDDVHNVREGRSPAQFQGQLGAHASTRQRGDRDLEERKGQNPQALGSELAGPGAEPGQQVLVGLFHGIATLSEQWTESAWAAAHPVGVALRQSCPSQSR